MAAIGLRRRSRGWVRSTTPAIQRNRSRSRSKARSMPGRNILTATSRPPTGAPSSAAAVSCAVGLVTAKCTCAIDAAAIGSSSKLSNRSSIEPSSSASTAWRASAEEKGGRSSCNADKSLAMVSPARSGRVLSIWPNLMKLGPSSCSAIARRSPGRSARTLRLTRKADSSRAARMRPLVAGSQSSGNSASCSASVRAMPTSLRTFRSARSISYGLRSATPSGWRRYRPTDCGSSPGRNRHRAASRQAPPAAGIYECFQPDRHKHRGRARPRRQAGAER